MIDEPGENPPGPRPRVIGFGSHEEVLAWMKQNEEEANAGVLPDQEMIRPGSYFFRLAEAHLPDPLQIFGYVYRPEEIIQQEMSAGASEDEAADVLAVKRDSSQRGYLYGMHYSVVTPEGEAGSTHRVNCWPISVNDFHWAKQHHWKISPDAMNRIMNEMEEAVAQAGGTLEGPVED